MCRNIAPEGICTWPRYDNAFEEEIFLDDIIYLWFKTTKLLKHFSQQAPFLSRDHMVDDFAGVGKVPNVCRRNMTGLRLYFCHLQRSCCKVIFSQACVKNSVHSLGGVHSRGVWQRGMHGRGACMVGGMHGGGGMCGRGACMVGTCMVRV